MPSEKKDKTVEKKKCLQNVGMISDLNNSEKTESGVEIPVIEFSY